MAESRSGRATMIGVLVGIVDVEIWRHFVPSVTDIRIAQPFDGDIESAERTALLVGTVFTVAVAALCKSVEVFAIGGLVLVALDFSTKYANAVSPDSGKLAGVPAMSGVSTSFPIPDYNGEQNAA